jgi:hypothetical protein
MKRITLIAATTAMLAVTAVTAPAPAEARGGFGPGLAGGLIAGAVIGGIASNAYGYGPGYGYYGGMGQAIMADMPLPTMADMLLPMGTPIGACIVPPTLTMVARAIMAAGTEVGVTTGEPATKSP